MSSDRYRQSPRHEVLFGQLENAGLGEVVISVARVLSRVLDFEEFRSFSIFTASQEAGVPLPDFSEALALLISVGVLQTRTRAFLGHRQIQYRLEKPIIGQHFRPNLVDDLMDRKETSDTVIQKDASA